jgi:hypothetical protein
MSVQNSAKTLEHILEIGLVIIASKLHLLTEGDNVRWFIQVEVFVTPHLASRATTSLHFVNQQRSSILEAHPQIHYQNVETSQ